MAEGVDDRGAVNEGVEDREDCGVNDGVDDLGKLKDREGVEARGALNEGVDERGMLKDREGVEERGALNDGVEDRGMLNDRELPEDRLGARNEGVAERGALNERELPEDLLGARNEGIDLPDDPDLLIEGLADRPPVLRETLAPDERETEALRAQVEVGAISPINAIASPRVRATEWCDNILKPRCRFEGG